jgi:hypothetical protein
MTDFDDTDAWARNMRGSFLAAATGEQRLAVFDRVLGHFVSADKEAGELRKYLDFVRTILASRKEVIAFLQSLDETPETGETN